MLRFFPFPGSGQRRSKSLTTAVLLLGGILGAYLTSQLVLQDDRKGLALIALGFAGLAFALKILNNWRQGLYLFFGWLFFEDFARKYLGNNMVIYFAKDFLVILVYLSFWAARRRRKDIATFKPPFLVPLLIMVWFAVGQVFNPGSPSIFYGLLGLKIYFLYVPLMYLGYALIDSELELRRFFMLNAALLFIVGGLGIAQSIIGPTFLNPGTLQEEIRELSTLYRMSPITGQMAYRPTSLFVSTGRFQNLIIASWMIIVGFGGYLLLRSKKGRPIAFTAIGVLAGAAVMSTSRGVVMWCGGSTLVIVAAFLWGAPWKQREVARVFRSVQRVALLGGLMILLLAVIFPEEVGSRFAIYSETLSPYSSASELAFRTRDYPLKNFLAAFNTPRWPYGYGTGTSSLGIQYVARIFHAPSTGVAVENGYGQLVIEMGILGLLLWILLGVSICASAWKVVKRLRGSPWFPLAFVIFWFAFMVFFPIGYNTLSFYQDFLVNTYLWLLLGILFRLPQLALSAQFSLGTSRAFAPQEAVATPTSPLPETSVT
ncbi:MAG TPA: hypothetical protein VFN20_10005 [Candidatus Acidoferrum sp.]|nr:hypothetical protein [Candidatus Acidoferrum sp.]